MQSLLSGTTRLPVSATSSRALRRDSVTRAGKVRLGRVSNLTVTRLGWGAHVTGYATVTYLLRGSYPSLHRSLRGVTPPFGVRRPRSYARAGALVQLGRKPFRSRWKGRAGTARAVLPSESATDPEEKRVRPGKETFRASVD